MTQVEMYESLLGSLEKIFALVTFAYLLSRMTFFRTLCEAHPRSSKDWVRVFLFFSVLAIVELFFSPKQTPGSSRAVAATVAGLLSGPIVGMGVGLVAATGNAFLLGTQAIYGGIATVAAGLLGGWVAQYRPDLRLKALAGLIVGALSHTIWLGVVFAQDTSVGSWDAVALVYGPPVFFNGAAATLFLVVIGDIRAQHERLERRSEIASKAELRALEAQVHPHFLFNALNTIAALCDLDSARAKQVAIDLGAYYRTAVRRNGSTLVPLSEELSNVQHYLAIEKARFGDRISVAIKVEDGLGEQLVPALSLQCLVENAILHGLSTKPGVGKLRITVETNNGNLRCWVIDDGAGMTKEQMSKLFSNGDEPHGLTILKNRLDMLYDGEFKLRIRSEAGKGTAALMRVPILESRRCDAGDNRR